ncbi:MAG: NAD-dependent epimerase/dehydratase family protein [Myxococcota bacterium]
MTVLVAGCGYVGSAFARLVLASSEDAEVIGLRRTVSKLPPGVRGVAADLGDRAGLAEALAPVAEEIDLLVYAAAADARTDEAYVRAYVNGLDNVLAALADAPLRRALFTSSTAVYGQQEGWVDEASPTEPASFSGRRLLEAEARLAAASTESVSLRLGGIYGPGRTRLVQRVEQGDVGANRWTNRIHLEDCAGAIAHLLALPNPDSVYVGVDEAQASLADVAALIADCLACERPVVNGAPKGKRCRSERLRQTYTLRVPSYREGYPEIVDAYRATRT